MTPVIAELKRLHNNYQAIARLDREMLDLLSAQEEEVDLDRLEALLQTRHLALGENQAIMDQVKAVGGWSALLDGQGQADTDLVAARETSSETGRRGLDLLERVDRKLKHLNQTLKGFSRGRKLMAAYKGHAANISFCFNKKA